MNAYSKQKETITTQFEAGPPPPDVMYYINQTSKPFHDGNYEKVLEILNTAGSSADHPELLNIRGAALTELLRYDEARPFFEQALKIRPTAFWPAHNLAEIDLQTKKYTKAKQQFTALKQRFPDLELLDLKIFICELLGGESDIAEKTLAQANLNPDRGLSLLYQAAWSYHHGNSDAGGAALKKYEKTYPSKSVNFFISIFVDQGWILAGGIY